METKSVPQKLTPGQLGLWHIEGSMLEIIQQIPDLPPPVTVWSGVFPGLELPLQALRHCYLIEGIDESDICIALTLPGFIGNGGAAWEYQPERNVVLTTDKLLAGRLKAKGRRVTSTTFVVGLVYSEMLSELEQCSTQLLEQFTAFMKQGVVFCFQKCSLRDGLEALSNSMEKGAVSFKDDIVSCKSLRIALELVNITGKAPVLLTQNHIHAFG